MFNLNKKSNTHFNYHKKIALEIQEDDVFNFIGFQEFQQKQFPLFNNIKSNSTIVLPRNITNIPEKIKNFKDWVKSRDELEPGTIIKYTDVEEAVA
jgi:hypothetical protein